MHKIIVIFYFSQTSRWQKGCWRPKRGGVGGGGSKRGGGGGAVDVMAEGDGEGVSERLHDPDPDLAPPR